MQVTGELVRIDPSAFFVSEICKPSDPGTDALPPRMIM